MELVERFIKLVAGLLRHASEDTHRSREGSSSHTQKTTAEQPVVTTFVSSSDFVGEFNLWNADRISQNLGP